MQHAHRVRARLGRNSSAAAPSSPNTETTLFSVPESYRAFARPRRSRERVHTMSSQQERAFVSRKESFRSTKAKAMGCARRFSRTNTRFRSRCTLHDSKNASETRRGLPRQKQVAKKGNLQSGGVFFVRNFLPSSRAHDFGCLHSSRNADV